MNATADSVPPLDGPYSGEPFPDATSGPRWRLNDRARAMVTRLVLLALLLVALDGAITWYATNQAAAAVSDIEFRDGVVAIDGSDLAMVQAAEIRRSAGNNGNRIRLGAVKWIPAVLIAAGAGLFTSRADPAMRRSLVMAVALTLAIWVTPRVVYSRELAVLDAIFG